MTSRRTPRGNCGFGPRSTVAGPDGLFAPSTSDHRWRASDQRVAARRTVRLAHAVPSSSTSCRYCVASTWPTRQRRQRSRQSRLSDIRQPSRAGHAAVPGLRRRTNIIFRVQNRNHRHSEARSALADRPVRARSRRQRRRPRLNVPATSRSRWRQRSRDSGAGLRQRFIDTTDDPARSASELTLGGSSRSCRRLPASRVGVDVHGGDRPGRPAATRLWVPGHTAGFQFGVCATASADPHRTSTPAVLKVIDVTPPGVCNPTSRLHRPLPVVITGVTITNIGPPAFLITNRCRYVVE